LVAVLLSAQCTDKRVNMITPKLFHRFPTPYEFAEATVDEVMDLISSCNHFRNKAKYLVELSKILVHEFDGEVPMDRDKLMKLPGIGRKSANVILIEAKGANIMAVDTHVFRVAHRLGLSDGKTPEAVERDLTNIFKTDLAKLHQAMVLFGRYICKAKNPECSDCKLRKFCSF
jgi:endonuclease-3